MSSSSARVTDGSDPAADPGPPPPLRPTLALVDLDAIAWNVSQLRRLTRPEALVMAVVKADGYGHGLCETAETCIASGASWLGVAILDEALRLRKAGIGAPVLIIGYSAPFQAAAVVEADLRATVFTLEAAEALGAAALARRTVARVHLKVDTGMSRLGIWPSPEGARLVERIAAVPGIELEGVFTHFAAADEERRSFAYEQLERFLGFIQVLRARGIEIPMRHAANSAALLEMPESHLDMVRPGVLVGGLWPSRHVRRRVELRPAMTVLTEVAYVKEVPPGRVVSYGCTYRTGATATLATLPLGYHDGYKRALSGRAEVLVRGRRAPVRGRVCMDQVVVDVTGIEGLRAGELVLAMGRQGGEEVGAEELADLAGSISYEIVTTFGARVPRLYVSAGQPTRLKSQLGTWQLRGWQDLPWLPVETRTLTAR